MSPVLVLLVIGAGLLGYGWWSLGENGRLEWLWAVRRGGGYGPVPADMLAQLEWLVMNRLGDLEGMVMLFLLAAAAGSVEGKARREAVVLSGFGLRLLEVGRALGLVWMACLVAVLLAPVPLPYVQVASALTVLLGVATFTLARGLRRVQ